MSADKLALHMIGTIYSEIIQVSADKVGKKNQFDLVELAAQVKLASATSYFASLHDHWFSASNICQPSPFSPPGSKG